MFGTFAADTAETKSAAVVPLTVIVTVGTKLSLPGIVVVKLKESPFSKTGVVVSPVILIGPVRSLSKILKVAVFWPTPGDIKILLTPQSTKILPAGINAPPVGSRDASAADSLSYNGALSVTKAPIASS
jgi:hypothetical protein